MNIEHTFPLDIAFAPNWLAILLHSADAAVVAVLLLLLDNDGGPLGVVVC
jgi:hypothetical protein